MTGPVTNIRDARPTPERQLADSVERHPASGVHRCCGGFAEHFDSCEVGEAIAAARWRIARSEILSFPRDSA